VVKPYKLDISQFGEKVRDKMKFTITNVSDEDVALTLIAGMPGIASLDLPTEIKAGQSARGEITLTPEMLTEEFEKSFTFEVGDEAKTRFTVPVKRSIKKPTTAAKTDRTSSGH
jgi:hypothetical protein